MNEEEEIVLVEVVVSLVLDENDEIVAVTWEPEDASKLQIVGMLEMAKDTILHGDDQ